MGVSVNFTLSIVISALLLAYLFPARKREIHTSALVNSIILLAFLNILTDLVAKLGIGIGEIRVYLLTAVLALFVISHRKKETWRSFLTLNHNFPIYSSLLVTIWVFVMPMKLLSNRGLSWGMAAMGNNDLPFYAAIAKMVYTSGYSDPGPIANLQNFGGGWISNFSYHGVTTIINYVQLVCGLDSWQATFPAFGFSVYLLCLSIVTLCTRLKLSKVKSLLITFVIVNLPIMSYQIAQGFFGYVLCFAFIIAVIALSPWKLKTDHYFEKNLISVLALISAVYSYPHIGLTFSALYFLSLVAILVYSLAKKSEGLLTFANQLILAFLLFIVCLLPISQNLMLLIQATYSTNEAGWKLISFNPFSLYISASSINKIYSTQFLWFLWITYLLVLIWLIYKSPKKYRNYLISTTIIFHFLAVVFSARYGFESYKSWKILGWLHPVFVMYLLLHYYANSKKNTSVVPVFLFSVCCAFNPIAVWNPGLPGQLPTATTKEVSLLHKEELIDKRFILNVEGRNMWESMELAAALPNAIVYVAGESYFQDSRPNALETCSIVPVNKLDNSDKQIAIFSDLTLIAVPSQCRPAP
jgi:hypothetical protein